jgi:hypothetical protein
MELIYLLPRLPPSRWCFWGLIESAILPADAPQCCDGHAIVLSSTSSSLPLRSPHSLPPRENIAAAVVNASSSSTHPLSSRFSSTRLEAIGGTWCSTSGARGPCPTPTRGTHPPGVIRTRLSAATDRSRVSSELRKGVTAINKIKN